MADFFPIFLDLKGKRCLVVGAGEIASGKAAQLLKYGAKLTIVAPDVSDHVRAWADNGEIILLHRPFEPSDLDGQILVVGSTNDPEVNKRVYEEATARGIWANIVDVPELCSFIYGAIVERGDLQIAISTSGKSPAFASHLRKQLESQFGEQYAEYLKILAEARKAGRSRLKNIEQQKAAYSAILKLDLLDLIERGEIEEAREKALEVIKSWKS